MKKSYEKDITKLRTKILVLYPTIILKIEAYKKEIYNITPVLALNNINNFTRKNILWKTLKSTLRCALIN